MATDHAHPEAIGVVDEPGVAKSVKQTVGVGRQWNGNRGKVANCVVEVHLSYATPEFQCLLDAAQERSHHVITGCRNALF